jgi:hypothetical protein
MEFEFATRNVFDYNSTVLDLTTDEGVGLKITASEVKLIPSSGNPVSTKFKPEENNRISVVITAANNLRERLMFICVNGVMCGASQYNEGANFRCNKNIKFFSDADVVLKQILIYNRSLTEDDLLNNYILYQDSLENMLDIYLRNDVVTNGFVDPDKLTNTLPILYFTCLDDEKNSISGGIPALEKRTDPEAKDLEIYCAINYVHNSDKTKNFSIDRARVRLQGTSSIGYPKKNWRFYTAKKYGTMLNHEGEVIEDGMYSFEDNAIPTDRWCLKADYAESSSSHNTGTARI